MIIKNYTGRSRAWWMRTREGESAVESFLALNPGYTNVRLAELAVLFFLSQWSPRLRRQYEEEIRLRPLNVGEGSLK